MLQSNHPQQGPGPFQDSPDMENCLPKDILRRIVLPGFLFQTAIILVAERVDSRIIPDVTFANGIWRWH